MNNIINSTELLTLLTNVDEGKSGLRWCTPEDSKGYITDGLSEYDINTLIQLIPDKSIVEFYRGDSTYYSYTLIKEETALHTKQIPTDFVTYEELLIDLEILELNSDIAIKSINISQGSGIKTVNTVNDLYLIKRLDVGTKITVYYNNVNFDRIEVITKYYKII